MNVFSSTKQDLFSTNVFGGLNVARAFLPYMRERKAGTVVWLGSIGGYRLVVLCFCCFMPLKVLSGEALRSVYTPQLSILYEVTIQFCLHDFGKIDRTLLSSLGKSSLRNIPSGAPKHHIRARLLPHRLLNPWKPCTLRFTHFGL